MRTLAALAALMTLATSTWAAAPEVAIALSVSGPTAPGELSEALPVRFVLLEDGQVFVGGTSDVANGRLEKKDTKALEKLVERVKKLPGIGAPQTLGPGENTYRLSLKKVGEIVAKGDPSRAAANVKPLGLLIETLLAFDHPSLRPYAPASFLLSARETNLPGGCRSWLLPPALPEVLKQPRVVAAAATAGWPTGATPAVVCEGERRYAVTLRPLLPGEALQ
jgi:hypothetical protein